MIKLTDAALLAYTKLRTRTIRTFITVLLASILFGILVAASLAANGLLSGINAFRKDGLTSRYIVSVHNAPTDGDESYETTRDPKIIAEAKKALRSHRHTEDRRGKASWIRILSRK